MRGKSGDNRSGGTGGDMNLDDFVAKARRLAKPATDLVEGSGSDPLAFWHGGFWDGLPLITFAYRGTWFELTLDDDGSGSVVPVDKPRYEGMPLVGSPAPSLPPVDAVFQLADPEVEAYLAKHGWSAQREYYAGFPDPMPGQYQELWMSQCPVYTGQAAAVFGGWNYPWPDGDWEELAGKELVLWTLKDAEPWVEVFRDGDGFIVMQRTT